MQRIGTKNTRSRENTQGINKIGYRNVVLHIKTDGTNAHEKWA